MHWALPTDSQRTVWCVPSASRHWPISLCWEFSSRQRLGADRAWSKLLLSFGEHGQHVLCCLGQISRLRESFLSNAVTESFGELQRGEQVLPRSKLYPCSVSAITQGLGTAMQHAVRKMENRAKTGVRKWRAETSENCHENSVQLRGDNCEIAV